MAILREAQARDIPLLVRMIQELDALENIHQPDEVLARTLEGLLRDPNLGKIWMIGSDSGYATLSFGYDLEFGGRDAWLTDIYLSPVERGKGLAKQAMREIEAQALKLGVRAINLGVRPDNPVARELYESVGYQAIPRVWMTKTLGRALFGDSLVAGMRLAGWENFGIGGQTTSEILARAEQVKDCNLLLISAGTNDLGRAQVSELPQVEARIREAWQMLHGLARAIFLNLPPLRKYGTAHQESVQRLNAYLCEKKFVHLDFYKFVEERTNRQKGPFPNKFFEDHVHPTTRGYDEFLKGLKL